MLRCDFQEVNILLGTYLTVNNYLDSIIGDWRVGYWNDETWTRGTGVLINKIMLFKIGGKSGFWLLE